MKLKKMDILLFLIFSIINSIKSFLKAEIINSFIEKKFMLTNTDLAKIYYYYPRITDENHEIILQINSTFNGNAYLCTGYFLNKTEENIFYNMVNNEFINCQKKYNIKSIDYFEEYIITAEFNSTFKPNNNGHYFIALYIDKNNIQDFSGTIIAFTTNMIIPIDEKITSKHFLFKNNYFSKNYTFIIYPNKLIKKNLNIQIETINEVNLFDLYIKNNDNFYIEEKNNIFSYNNFLNISNGEIDYYILNLIFLKSNNEIDNLDFAIYFEYNLINNSLNQLPDYVSEITFLTKSDYYFYQKINNINCTDQLFYIANDFSLKRGMISLSSLEINVDLNYLNNNTYLEKQIFSSSFINCKSRLSTSLSLFKCIINNNNSNIIILKISSSGINPLKIRKIHFKELKRNIINEKELYYKPFNSDFLIDKIGYLYIPKTNEDNKFQLIYCSMPNTMSILFGDYDIIEPKSAIQNLEKTRILKISHNNNDYSCNNFTGFTILSYNKDYNYFIQIIDINKDIYENLLIENVLDKTHLNKEISFNIPIKNYYIFFINDYDEEYKEIIFDIERHYGNIDIKYIDIDLIPENNFNLSKILLFNSEDYPIIDAKHPILIRKTTEFIKIINNRYNIEYFYKSKFYIKRYLIKENKKWDSLIPIYLNPLEIKTFSLDKFGIINYVFKLGDNYNDYTYNKDENLVSIIIGNNIINNVFNLTNKKNIIKGNEIYISFGDTIKFINYFNQSILIWANLGIKENENENIVSLCLSQNFYYLYSFSFVHKLSFDWFNIKKKINYGLIPQNILISFFNEQQTRTNGYYYQVLNLGNDNNDYLYYHSHINSIYYELNQGESHIFLSENINLTVFDYYYKDNTSINYMIYPSSGLSTILFYVEYLYDITNYVNVLKFLKFDDSIYSLNLKLDNKYIKYRHLYDNYNYLVFQSLSCNLAQSKVNFKYNISTYNQDNYNKKNININNISSGNILGYININFFNEYIEDDNLFINIIKPYQTYIKYYYTPNINQNYTFQNNYNINVEKGQYIDNNNVIIVSFDCFLKDIKTNYTILILNKTDVIKEITNECEFFSYIEKRNNYSINLKYLSFIDSNENTRIKKEITFDNFGNYAIYLLAQSLDNLPIYKYLGTESYTYTNDFYHNKNNNENIDNNIQEILFFFVFIVLIIILIILFIVFRYVRKKKILELFNSINSSLLSDELNRSKNSIIEFNNINNIKDFNEIDNNSNYINTDDIDNNFLLFEKPIIEKDNKNELNSNKIENNNKEKEEDFELDPGLLGQSPAPLLGKTYCSEEDRIRDEMAKINDSSNNNKNIIDKEKTYINTYNGYG